MRAVVLLFLVFNVLLIYLGWCKAFSITHQVSKVNLDTSGKTQVGVRGIVRSGVPTVSFPEIALTRVFENDHSWIASVAAESIVTVTASGDIIPARSVNYQSTARSDFSWLYSNIASVLEAADLTLINLETPLMESCRATNEGMKFCGSTKHMEGLSAAGIDAINMANNHIHNYGYDGFIETEKLIQSYNIVPFGTTALNPIITRKGKRILLLGYNDIGSTPDYIRKADARIIQSNIESARLQADIIIVNFHWGVEYERFPTERQRYLAHLAIESGASLVVGNHPHWIQPLEIYKGIPIMYAHGNTVFDQMWSEDTRKGVLAKYYFYNNKVVDIQFYPTYIRDYGQPIQTNTENNSEILHMLEKSSYQWAM